VIEKLIAKIARCLDDEKVPYMIIGGQAVLLYGRPRLTRDIDITLGIDCDKFATIEQICNKLELKFLPERPEDFANQTRAIPAQDSNSGFRIDFIFSFTDYESQAIANAKSVSMDNYPTKFAACEDLIIHKLIAARAIDIEDVRSVINKNRQNINLAYIRKWLWEFSQIPEYEKILNSFNNLWQ